MFVAGFLSFPKGLIQNATGLAHRLLPLHSHPASALVGNPAQSQKSRLFKFWQIKCCYLIEYMFI
jgi:hypothetical protein